jgi:hypothetical protein
MDERSMSTLARLRRHEAGSLGAAIDLVLGRIAASNRCRQAHQVDPSDAFMGYPTTGLIWPALA